MQVELGPNLQQDAAMRSRVENCLGVLDEMFGAFQTANALIELGKDYRGRDIIRMIVKDHGRTVQTAFAPDELGSTGHFRDRCYQFVGQIASLQLTNDCPNCGMKYGAEPLPFHCRICDFQIVQRCPACENEVSLSEYLVIDSTLWRCPRCNNLVRSRYAEPMFDSRGFFVQPLVELTVAPPESTTQSHV